MRIVVMTFLFLFTWLLGWTDFGQSSSTENIIRPASYLEVGTLTVSEHLIYHKKDRPIIVGRAAGFSTTDCDFVTAFSAIEEYERKETWDKEDQQTLQVTIDGQVYEGKLRSHGHYPLGLNLACIDLIPNSREPVNIVRLKVANIFPDNTYVADNTVMESPMIGFPIINKYHEVVAIYIDSKTFVSGKDITRFLKFVDGLPKTFPELHTR